MSSQRKVFLPLLACAAFVATTALSLGKPGLPSQLRGVEGAYYMLTTSMVHDRDLVCEADDLERLFRTYPYSGPAVLPLHVSDHPVSGHPVSGRHVSSQGDARATFDLPMLYPLLALPFVAAFGANGFGLLNLLLLSLAIGSYIATREPEQRPRAVLWAVAFFALSAIFPYLFWLHPTILWATLTTLAFAGTSPRLGERRRWLALAGASAGIALVQLPVLILLLPALAWRAKARRGLTSWGGATLVGVLASLALAMAAGSALPWTSSDSDGHRSVYRVAHPDDLSWQGVGDAKAPDILGAPTPSAIGPWARAGYLSLVEQRSGLLPYFPLVLIILLALGLEGRRPHGGQVILLLGALAAVLVVTRYPGLGVGGTLLGDPWKAAIYPAFLFLLIRVPAAGSILGAYAVGILFIGPMLAAMLGSPVAYGDVQGHTRGWLMTRLPLATDYVGAAGIYRPSPLGGDANLDARLWWPRYAGEKRGDELWLLGGERASLWLDTATPIDQTTEWRLLTHATDNQVRMHLGGDTQRMNSPDELPPMGFANQLTFDPGLPTPIDHGGVTRYVYPLVVASDHGAAPAWNGGPPSSFYLGAALTFLGPTEVLERQVFALDTLGCGAPPTASAGEPARALLRVRNTSAATWPNSGSVRVRVGHGWLDSAGNAIAHGGRSELPKPVEPGEEIALWIDAVAPAVEPGTHRLQIDLVYENVAWFADRRQQPACEIEIAIR